MQTLIHYFLHFGLPVIVAYLLFRKEWIKISFILLVTMLVDLDHLLATPIFKANRCSFGFHLLHSYYAIVLYFILLFLKKPYNIIGLGLLLHMVTDLIDCMFMYTNCKSCFTNAPAIKILETFSNFLGL